MSRLSPQEEITLLRKKARRRLVGAIALVAIAIAVLWNTLGKTPQQIHPEQIAIVPENASSSQAQPPVATSSTPLTIQEPQEPEQHPASTPVATQPPPQPRHQTASATAIAPTDDTATQAAEEAKAKAAQAKAEKAEKAAKEKEKRLAEEKARQEKEKAAAKTKENQPPKPTDKPKKPEADPAAILDGRADAGSKNTGLTPVSNTPSKRVMIQLAALSDQAKIDSMKSKLSSLGVNASFSKVQTSKGEATRVRVGPFASRAEADVAMAKLSRAGLSGIVLP